MGAAGRPDSIRIPTAIRYVHPEYSHSSKELPSYDGAPLKMVSVTLSVMTSLNLTWHHVCLGDEARLKKPHKPPQNKHEMKKPRSFTSGIFLRSDGTPIELFVRFCTEIRVLHRFATPG